MGLLFRAGRSAIATLGHDMLCIMGWCSTRDSYAVWAGPSKVLSKHVWCLSLITRLKGLEDCRKELSPSLLHPPQSGVSVSVGMETMVEFGMRKPFRLQFRPSALDQRSIILALPHKPNWWTILEVISMKRSAISRQGIDYKSRVRHSGQGMAKR